MIHWSTTTEASVPEPWPRALTSRASSREKQQRAQPRLDALGAGGGAALAGKAEAGPEQDQRAMAAIEPTRASAETFPAIAGRAHGQQCRLHHEQQPCDQRQDQRGAQRKAAGRASFFSCWRLAARSAADEGFDMTGLRFGFGSGKRPGNIRRGPGAKACLSCRRSSVGGIDRNQCVSAKARLAFAAIRVSAGLETTGIAQ